MDNNLVFKAENGWIISLILCFVSHLWYQDEGKMKCVKLKHWGHKILDNESTTLEIFLSTLSIDLILDKGHSDKGKKC